MKRSLGTFEKRCSGNEEPVGVTYVVLQLKVDNYQNWQSDAGNTFSYNRQKRCLQDCIQYVIQDKLHGLWHYTSHMFHGLSHILRIK